MKTMNEQQIHKDLVSTSSNVNMIQEIVLITAKIKRG